MLLSDRAVTWLCTLAGTLLAVTLCLLGFVPHKFIVGPVLAVVVGCLLGRKNAGAPGAAIGGTIALVAAAIAAGSFSSQLDQSRAGLVMNVEGPTLSGEHFDLKDHPAKCTLVDFWATWCLPCMIELPNIKRAYNEFHDRGFNVVGVSLDQDKESLSTWLASHKLDWTTIFYENPGGWKNPLAKQFRVHSIPGLFLLNDKQELLCVNPRGPQLREAVKAALHSAETHEPFKVSGSLVFAPVFLVTGPLLLLVGSFGGALLEIQLRRKTKTQSATDQVTGTCLIDLGRSYLTFCWGPFLVILMANSLPDIPMKTSVIAIFGTISAYIMLVSFCELAALEAFFHGKTATIKKIVDFTARAKTLLRHSWIRRIYADCLFVKENNTEAARQEYESLLNLKGPAQLMSNNLVRDHLALSTNEPQTHSGDLARAHLMAVITFSTTIFATWAINSCL